jgi:hypothetical protein
MFGDWFVVIANICLMGGLERHWIEGWGKISCGDVHMWLSYLRLWGEHVWGRIAGDGEWRERHTTRSGNKGHTLWFFSGGGMIGLGFVASEREIKPIFGHIRPLIWPFTTASRRGRRGNKKSQTRREPTMNFSFQFLFLISKCYLEYLKKNSLISLIKLYTFCVL